MKKHTLLYSLNHTVNTKYALNKYTQISPKPGQKKTAYRKVFDVIGVKIYNSMPYILLFFVSNYCTLYKFRLLNCKHLYCMKY